MTDTTNSTQTNTDWPSWPTNVPLTLTLRAIHDVLYWIMFMSALTAMATWGPSRFVYIQSLSWIFAVGIFASQLLSMRGPKLWKSLPVQIPVVGATMVYTLWLSENHLPPGSASNYWSIGMGMAVMAWLFGLALLTSWVAMRATGSVAKRRLSSI